ncbi:hybrid sensor histidine kinase/response regulator [Leptospira gomenensis]|uniref:histidine kinase n=1 Tax=Leptospira gomenensis TaxID=2484974 RepID=A0A5F1YDL6_9LEPT|nr:hybrid sensor histidine kinase/response regulator [Leptospira gomenensis]TGK33795.1 hybrid sensor histidine kinase/response regulator [Leptospira gomenensis]TGK36364.1 hybrid sensor histidine kinase/response regulator [Leptospira gomenensis]TGK47388.1 hybrid sensor histidine kinase/response regulator [Leptospira gomenensis]TGK60663.1 hybrid sensor histidine kinase/response regulator [Leptospira gomenensis]
MMIQKKVYILCLEDNPNDLGLMIRQIGKSGLDFSYKQIQTKEELIQELKASEPDLILSDFSMPSFDGMEALEIAKRYAPITPFLFVSGWLGEEAAIEALKRGATDYISKNKISKLNFSIERALREAEERNSVDEIEKQNETLKSQLIQAQKLEAISLLATGVAHEINNPLTIIINFAQLILAQSKDEPILRYASNILEEGERISKITKDLLRLSRQEKNIFSKVDFREVVQRTVSLCEQLFKKDNIQINLNIPEDIPEIECVPQQIQQVVLNLLNNARDALNQRYPKYDADKLILISAKKFEKEDKPWIQMCVEDRGVGIPRDEAMKIFSPFFTTKKVDKGTGLGLSVSTGIVKDHGGELFYESKENEYTRFFINLPVFMEPFFEDQSIPEKKNLA